MMSLFRYSTTGLVASLVTPSGECGVSEPAMAPDPVAAVRRGLPVGEVQALRQLLDYTEEEVIEVVGIAQATWQRRKKSGHLNRLESERVLRIARLLGLAREVFESLPAAIEWLSSPAPGLGGESPFQYSDTEPGAREVEQLLHRIDRGIFS